MKATVLLKRQHDEVRSIFKQLEKANGHSKDLLKKLAADLAAHMVIEQELFYPAVVNVKEALVLERLRRTRCRKILAQATHRDHTLRPHLQSEGEGAPRHHRRSRRGGGEGVISQGGQSSRRELRRTVQADEGTFRSNGEGGI
jgi:hypothetical protein